MDKGEGDARGDGDIAHIGDETHDQNQGDENRIDRHILRRGNLARARKEMTVDETGEQEQQTEADQEGQIVTIHSLIFRS
jgi:hypothetical protein